MRLSKQYFAASFIALALLCCACSTKENPLNDEIQKEINPESSPEEIERPILTWVKAGIDDLQKTSISGSLVYWENGDKISINAIPSEALEIDAPSLSASFAFSEGVQYPYKAIYPSYTGAGHGTVVLPHDQDYVASGIYKANGSGYMCAYAADEDEPLVFHHLVCAIQITVKSKAEGTTPDDIAYIEFCGRNDEQVSGSFGVDFSAASLTSRSGAAADKVVRVVPAEPLSTTSANTFNIVVPAGTYTNGFTVKLVGSDGKYMEKSKGSATTLAAGHIHPLTAFAFKDVVTPNVVEIANATTLLSEMKKVNDGGYASGASGMTFRLTADLDFTDHNATFASEGYQGFGRMTTDFDGVFDGNGHTISHFAGPYPLFQRVGPNGIVKDLTLDGSISSGAITGNTDVTTTVTTYYQFLCPVVAYLRGTLSNVHSSVDLTLGSTTNDHGLNTRLAVGGLVGRVINANGLIENCSYSGMITNTESLEVTSRLCVGGIVGIQDTSSGAAVRDCLCDGAITLDAVLKESETEGWQLYSVGGISGYCSQGSIIRSTSAATVTVEANENFRDSSYVHVGGITGHIRNAGIAQLYAVKNTGDVTINMTSKFSQKGRLMVGGIAGFSEYDNFDAEGDIVNTGNITLHADASWDNCNSSLCVGGIFGHLKQWTDSPTLKGLVNSGKVSYTDDDGVTGIRLCLGGIIGRRDSNGKKGILTLSDCKNSGDVKFDIDQTNPRSYDEIYYGGILGGAISDPIAISRCSNSGEVYGGVGTANITSENGRSQYLAGIAAYLCGGSSVNYCDNAGTIFNCEWNNHGGSKTTTSSILTAKTASIAAGIVAYSGGASGAGNGITISNCTMTGDVGGRRGTAGGIVGYASYTTISGCSNLGKMNHNDAAGGNTSSAYWIGGICGLMENSTINASHVAITGLKGTQTLFFGGICAVVGSGSTIGSGCSFSLSQETPTLKEETKCGFAAGIAASGTTISLVSTTSNAFTRWNNSDIVQVNTQEL